MLSVVALALAIGAAAQADDATSSREDDGHGTRGPYRAAVVIGQNEPDDDALETLRYADDDAVLTHALLVEAGADAILLTRLDDDTRALYPHLEAAAPDVTSLNVALGALFERLAAARARGQDTELIVYFSGHGDVTDGEGSIVLEDGRLKRSSLFRDVLAPSPAARNHVIVDACRSYFFAFAKGPGGRRAPATPGFFGVDDELSRRVRARTGFVLSTSRDEESHEWDRLQAGVFSHEVRSALRGAADADLDGRVGYRELAAFLSAANGGIANARFRPSFTVVPPLEDGEGEDALLVWPVDADELIIDDAAAFGHVIVESADGVRLADVPPSRGQTRRLALPPSRPLFVIDAARRTEREIATSGSVRLSELKDSVPRLAAKGARHRAFEALFKLPFGAVDVRAARFASPDAHVVPDTTVGTSVPLVATSIALGGLGGALALGALSSVVAAGTIAVTGLSVSQRERVERNQVILALDVFSVVAGLAAVSSFALAGTSLYAAHTVGGGLTSLGEDGDLDEREARALH